jgi:hydroxymethylglutaryl-CoA lyase
MMPTQKICLIECPRDAMQGWKYFIPTEKKIRYVNELLKVGLIQLILEVLFHPGQFRKWRIQKEVVKGLRFDPSKTNLLSIVANIRGAEEAIVFDEIAYLGFPFSISPTFQLRNTNSTMAASFEMVEEIQNLCIKNQKQLVIYISMGLWKSLW